jgi:arylsulfatase A-like enzyme
VGNERSCEVYVASLGKKAALICLYLRLKDFLRISSSKLSAVCCMRTFTALLCVFWALGLLPAQAAPRKRKRAAAPTQEAGAVLVPERKIPSAAGKPNVLFIVVDDLNDWVGWLGGHPQAKTPHMDRLAQTGVRFTNAHTPYALCNAARTAMLSGVAPWNSGVSGNEQDWRHAVTLQGKWTLPECFRLCGYTTAAGGKVFHANHGGPEGRLSGWHGGRRGFEQDAAWNVRFPSPGVQIADLPVHVGQNFNGLNIWHWDWKGIEVAEDRMDDAQTVAWASDFLANASDTAKQPFFLTVGIYRPHAPWYVPQRYFDAFPLDQIQLPKVQEGDLNDVPAFAKTDTKLHEQVLAKGAWKAAVQAYLANIAYADAQVGKLLSALESSPAAANTIICLTSDHGFYLGEKQQWQKGKLWERATHVPLSLNVPGYTDANSVCTQPVSLLDLYPTLVDLTRIEKPAHLDGKSLVNLLKNPEQPRGMPAITAMKQGEKISYAARSDRWRYIRYADGSEELYDHSTDAEEWTNLASQPAHAEIKSALQAALPKSWASASRAVAEILQLGTQQGWQLTNGDVIPEAKAPQIQGRGVDIEAAFNYVAEVDADSSIVSQGTADNGWILHLVEGRPTLSIFTAGKCSSVQASPMNSGFVVIRAQIPANGIISVCAGGQSEITESCPFPAGFPSQPTGSLQVGQSFGLLSEKDFPNSTPLDATLQRLWLTLVP